MLTVFIQEIFIAMSADPELRISGCITFRVSSRNVNRSRGVDLPRILASAAGTILLHRIMIGVIFQAVVIRAILGFGFGTTRDRTMALVLGRIISNGCPISKDTFVSLLNDDARRSVNATYRIIDGVIIGIFRNGNLISADCL